MNEWTPPTKLPDLRRVDNNRVALDIETLDKGLQADRGSSWPWRDGHVCGISLAWRAGGEMQAVYLSLRHPGSANFEPTTVYRWLRDHIAAGICFVGQNSIYDWGWMRSEGGVLMPPSDQLEELGALATIVNENLPKYSLDALCAEYGLPGKDETLLRQAVETAGFAPKRKKLNVQSHIWQMPARFVGPYAETDAVRTLEVFEKANPILDQENTRAAYRLDVELVPMVLAMRLRGIRIDQDAAEQARDLLLGKRDAALAEISAQLGSAVSMDELNSPKWKTAIFDANGIAYPRTPKGNPSFAAGKSGWMAKHPHWLPPLIATAAKYEAAGNKFIQGHIIDHIVRGRIHAEIHPFRAEDGGTRSSRFSYSEPPIQQMPSRDPELGPLIRGCFLPEEGEIWADADVSQQEFRLLTHYGVVHGLPGANEAAEAYRNDPKADFHSVVAQMTGLDRSSAKATNFAKIYGAGIKKMAEMIGKPVDEVRAIVETYDKRLPFVVMLSKLCQEKAVRIGYTVLYDGARRHWNLWEVARLFVKGAGPCAIEEAQRRVADPTHVWYRQHLSRAHVYTSLNAQIQGSAARHTKLWMRAVYRAGIIPMLQLHDSLSCSVTTREQAELVAQLGCDAVSLELPMRVDLQFGKNWGDAKHTWAEFTGEPEQPAKPSNPTSGSTISATIIPIRPEIVIEPKPGIVPPPKKPAIAIPIDYTAAAPAAPPQQPRPEPPPVDDTAGTEIDLADLIETPVPRSRKICCPFHGEKTPSLHVYPDHYYCFGCGAWGDHIDWLMQVEGLAREQAEDILANWQGPVIARSATRDAEDEAKRTAYALRWWRDAQPIVGTLAARYLTEARGINLAVLPDDISESSLRFHPSCVFGKGTRHPCLLALMCNPVTGQATGIHRTALDANAQKIDRMMLGPAGVVRLWPAGKQLVIGEGLETALSAATRLDYRGEPLRPAWAMLSDGAMERFPVLAGIERLIILADNDLLGQGQAAAGVCKQRWREAGRRVAVLTPDKPGTDFNDIILDEMESVAS